jgi:hypothetical protein
MMKHLSAQEFVDVLGGTLPADRQAHLGGCEACGREVAELRALVADAHVAGAVPDPSPLFWDHFSRRVRAATDRDPIVTPRWWESAWRPVGSLAAVAGAVALVALVYSGRAVAPGGATTAADVAGAAVEPTIDDGSMTLISAMASDLSAEELQQATRPTTDATRAVMDELTPAQRAEFIRLIKAEMGEPE